MEWVTSFAGRWGFSVKVSGFSVQVSFPILKLEQVEIGILHDKPTPFYKRSARSYQGRRANDLRRNPKDPTAPNSQKKKPCRNMDVYFTNSFIFAID